MQSGDLTFRCFQVCLYIINNDVGAAIYLTTSSLTMYFDLSQFIGCVSRAAGNSGAISVTPSSSNMHVSGIVFLSAYGSYCSGMYYSANQYGIIDISQISASGCWGKYSVIQLFYVELAANDFNGSFNTISEEYVFICQSALKTKSCFFYIYKNPTTIEYAITSPNSDNFLSYSIFVENSYQVKEYGVIHINYPNQVMYVDNCIFYHNTNYLFNPYKGQLIVSNITCDEYTCNGNAISTTFINSKSFDETFPSPLNAIFQQPKIIHITHFSKLYNRLIPIYLFLIFKN